MMRWIAGGALLFAIAFGIAASYRELGGSGTIIAVVVAVAIFVQFLGWLGFIQIPPTLRRAANVLIVGWVCVLGAFWAVGSLFGSSTRSPQAIAPTTIASSPAVSANREVLRRIDLLGENQPSQPVNLADFPGGWQIRFAGPTAARVHYQGDQRAYALTDDPGVETGDMTFTGPKGEHVTVFFLPPS